MIIKIKDVHPKDNEEWKKLILYTVKNKGYNKNTFKRDFENIIEDPLAKPNAVDNEYNHFKSYIETLDTSTNDFLTRAKEAFLSSENSDNKILLIAALYEDYLNKKRQYNLMQGKTFTKEDYKLAAYDVVSKNGYDRMFYLDQLSNSLEGDNTKYTHEVSEIDEWASKVLKNISTPNDMQVFQYEAIKIWAQNEITGSFEKKMLGIAVKTYLYYSKLGKKRPNKTLEEGFTVGDRISIVPHDFILLEAWEERPKKNYITVKKYHYTIKYNGMMFDYEGTVSPEQLKRCSKLTASIKNIVSSGDTKKITITNVRITY